MLPGQYLMRTSYKEIASIRHPGMGPGRQKFLGKINQDLPGNVVIGNSTGHPGRAFSTPASPRFRSATRPPALQNTQPPKYLQDNQFDRRMRLTSAFDGPSSGNTSIARCRPTTELYQEAIKLLKSQELKAFDIDRGTGQGPGGVWRQPAGPGLPAGPAAGRERRAVRRGGVGGWDMHRDCFDDDARTRRDARPGPLGAAHRSGSEADAGRHARRRWRPSSAGRRRSTRTRPRSPSGRSRCLLAGGGIQGGPSWRVGQGCLLGRVDRISVADFNATIAQALGLPHRAGIHSPSGRPFKIAHDGKPIVMLF